MRKNYFYLLVIVLIIESCQTFHLSTESLVEQLANSSMETKINLIIAPPLFIPGIVQGNSLQTLNVLNKKNEPVVLYVTNRTGIRITKKDSTRTTFYFDTLIIKDSLVTGKKDHFIGVNIKPINLNNILKIELQR